MTAKEIKDKVLNIIYRHFQILSIPISTKEILSSTNGAINIHDIESACKSLQKQDYISYNYNIMFNQNQVESISVDGREYVEGLNVMSNKTSPRNDNLKRQKAPILFISHSSKDKPFVGNILDLIKTLGVEGKDKIVCTSFPEYGFEYGKDWNHEMLKIFTEHIPYTIFVYTKSFFSSPVCMNEVGAVWGLQLNYFGIIPKGGDYNTLKCVIQPTNLTLKVDIDREFVFAGLDQLKNEIEKHFKLQTISPKEWNAAKEIFYNEVNKESEEVNESTTLQETSSRTNSSFDSKQRIFEYIQSNKSTTTYKISKELGLSLRTVRIRLNELISENKITFQGKGSSIEINVYKE